MMMMDILNTYENAKPSRLNLDLDETTLDQSETTEYTSTIETGKSIFYQQLDFIYFEYGGWFYSKNLY